MDIFTILAVPARREIIEILATEGTIPARFIYEKFNTSNAAVSQHLKVLRDAKIVSVEKQGQQRMYQLNIEKMYEYERWFHKVTTLWDKRFDTLETLLTRNPTSYENKNNKK